VVEGIVVEDVVALTEVDVVGLATTVVIVGEAVMLDVVTLACAGLCWAAVRIGGDAKLDITRNITTISKGTTKFLLNNGPG